MIEISPFLFRNARRVRIYGCKPIGNAVEVVNRLQDKGHDIYLCSYVRRARHHFIKSIVDFYGMKYTEILCRDKDEQYCEIVERLRPDILIDGQANCLNGGYISCKNSCGGNITWIEFN